MPLSARPRIGARPLAAALLALVLAALAAGCGGGSGEDEEALRGELKRAAVKMEKANSVRASIGFEAQDEEESEAEKLGCLNIASEGGHPDKVDLLSFDLGCEGGSEAHEVIVIGNRAWVSSEPEDWTAAKVPPNVVEELGDEEEKFDTLLAAADDLAKEEKGGAYATPNGGANVGPKYSFTAPSSSFADVAGGDSPEVDVDVDFTATVDHQGYLRELTASASEGGTEVRILVTYEDIDQPQGVEPPSPDEVSGPVIQVHSRQQLEDLIGSP